MGFLHSLSAASFDNQDLHQVMDDEAHHDVVSREFEKMVCCCFPEEMAIQCEEALTSRTAASIGLFLTPHPTTSNG
ncbi:hypothetical protein WN944_018471 [Citrus x changshan-huyou]|uniref:Uncharacterized protein n=1 Tax=Citrus x changshan-huyou TaxID=2935761 RepID=A0AAP0LUG9_9ROSI